MTTSSTQRQVSADVVNTELRLKTGLYCLFYLVINSVLTLVVFGAITESLNVSTFD